MYVEKRAESPIVSGKVTGEEIRRRREAAGLDIAELAREAEVSRTTLHSIEAGGGARGSSYGKVLRALEAAEAENGGVQVVPSETPDVEMIEFQVEGDFGVKVVVRGPISSHETLRADVAEIIRSIRKGSGEPGES